MLLALKAYTIEFTGIMFHVRILVEVNEDLIIGTTSPLWIPVSEQL
jgi:hypothetical protein